MMSLIAIVLCLLLAALRLLRGPKTVAGWTFAAGMLAFALEAHLHGRMLSDSVADAAHRWEPLALLVQTFELAIWLCFSLTYSRGRGREVLSRWKWVVVGVSLAAALFLGSSMTAWGGRMTPASLFGSGQGDIGLIVKGMNAVLLIFAALFLMNLEQTFRASVGTMRWRIKFVVLGLSLVFAAKVYVFSQAIIYSGQDGSTSSIQIAAFIVGSLLILLAYIRAGFAEIDVYPSQAVLRTSLTAILVGGYLLAVGVLAQVISHLGGTGSFQAQAFLVLLAVSALGALLLSDRLRQRLGIFVNRHFKKARHDSLQIWIRASRDLANVKNPREYGAVVARLISETFQSLSVTVWLVDAVGQQLVRYASTATQGDGDRIAVSVSAEALESIRGQLEPFEWAAIERLGIQHVPLIGTGGRPLRGRVLCLPFRGRDKLLAFACLEDRVSDMSYSLEEIELLKCLSEQFGAGLLNLRLMEELIQARELEAFQTMSAFFAHDLKNAASTLSLMLRNLPIHFDDPEFRQDALRAIGSTTTRINQLVESLRVFRGKLQLKPSRTDFNSLVQDTLGMLQELREVNVDQNLGLLSPIDGDREQLQSMLTNLLLNAREALGPDGRIRVETKQTNGCACLIVSDNGCGMSAVFVKDELFRAFRSTKKKGLGIGMFHTKAIVAAHGGTVQVESEPGKGTTFRISLPCSRQA
jgi:putative PEP-CTERM system histidine kinase